MTNVMQDRMSELDAKFRAIANKKDVEYYESIPDKFKKDFLECVVGEAGVSDRIHAICHECVFFKDVENSIKNCDSEDVIKRRPHQSNLAKPSFGKMCPLYKARPYRGE